MTIDISPEAVTKMLEGVTELREFLRGAGPLDGCWYGEMHRPAFWWRKHLKRIGDLTEAVPALAAENATLRVQLDATMADRALILAERDRTFALMLARAEAAEARVAELEVELEAERNAAREALMSAGIALHVAKREAEAAEAENAEAALDATVAEAVPAYRERLLLWVDDRRDDVAGCADLYANEESAAFVWLENFAAAIRALIPSPEPIVPDPATDQKETP